MKLKDFAKAEEEIKAAQEKNPLDAGLYYLLGWINQNRSQFGDAVDNLKKALYLDSRFVLAHFRLAAINERLGKYEAAMKGYENAKLYFEENRNPAFHYRS